MKCTKVTIKSESQAEDSNAETGAYYQRKKTEMVWACLVDGRH